MLDDLKVKKQDVDRKGLELIAASYHSSVFIDQPLTDGFNDDSRQSVSH